VGDETFTNDTAYRRSMDPSDKSMYPEQKSHEYMEMKTIQSLTSQMTRRKIMSLKRNEGKARIEEYVEVEHELMEEHHKVAGVDTNDRHSSVTPEELSRKLNIGIQTAKNTLGVTTQHGVIQ
jgi:ribosomal protein S25